MRDDREYGYEQYAEVAGGYHTLRDRRVEYIRAVNQLVCRHLRGRKRLLDIGAGDGVRISNVIDEIQVEQAILLEPCKEMANRIHCADKFKVVTVPVQEFELEQGHEVDAVTMLWNVFGHIPSGDRLMVAKKILTYLSPEGLLVLDVNNRHNRAAYGILKVAGRRLIDWILPDARRGDSTFTWHQAGSQSSGKGHLFTPDELIEIFHAAGFRLNRILTVNYQTGFVSESRHDGQLFAVFSR
jgi:2-polyprenyl-3-methyl-5-hydroxy-6-metoxy-1,4-benzoquinol methylase